MIDQDSQSKAQPVCCHRAFKWKMELSPSNPLSLWNSNITLSKGTISHGSSCSKPEQSERLEEHAGPRVSQSDESPMKHRYEKRGKKSSWLQEEAEEAMKYEGESP